VDENQTIKQLIGPIVKPIRSLQDQNDAKMPAALNVQVKNWKATVPNAQESFLRFDSLEDLEKRTALNTDIKIMDKTQAIKNPTLNLFSSSLATEQFFENIFKTLSDSGFTSEMVEGVSLFPEA
jgi:hypothetical protein